MLSASLYWLSNLDGATERKRMMLHWTWQKSETFPRNSLPAHKKANVSLSKSGEIHVTFLATSEKVKTRKSFSLQRNQEINANVFMTCLGSTNSLKSAIKRAVVSIFQALSWISFEHFNEGSLASFFTSGNKGLLIWRVKSSAPETLIFCR